MTPRLTHSKRSAFLFCPRSYYHRYECGLELANPKRGQRRGRIFGDALQAARDSEIGTLATQFAMASIDESYIEAFNSVNTQESMDELEIERSKVRVMAALYIKRYGLNARREVEYDLPFRNPATGGYSKTWRVAGKIDGLEVVGQRRARIVEDKFVSQLQQPMIDRLPLDNQTTEYVHALTVKGWTADVAFRHTRYPGINPEKAKEYKTRPDKPAETLDAFEERLEQDVHDRWDYHFDEQIIAFPTEHLAQFEQERWETGQMIIEARSRSARSGMAAFPKSPTRCWEYGGCKFIPLCCNRPDAMALYVRVDPEIELSERLNDGDE